LLQQYDCQSVNRFLQVASKTAVHFLYRHSTFASSSSKAISQKAIHKKIAENVT